MSTCVRKCLFGLFTAVLISLAVSNSRAAPIAFIYSGSGGGTLGTNTFTNLDFTITAIADTANIVSEPGFSGILTLLHDSASINIAGFGDLGFVDPMSTQTFVNQNIGKAGFQTRDGGVLDLFNLTEDDFKSWDLMSTIGPISGTGRMLQWDAVNIMVTYQGGPVLLNFVSGLTDYSFQSTPVSTVAAVPLPAALPLLASALALFGLLGWRRRVLTSA